MKAWVICYLLFCSTFFFWPQTQAKTFRFIAKMPLGTASHERIFLTGNQTELCHWKPNCIAMEKVDLNTFSADVELQDFQKLEYKVTRGSWDQEAADAFAQPYRNSFLIADQPLQILDISNWKDWGPRQIAKRLQIISGFKSKHLGRQVTLRILHPNKKHDHRQKQAKGKVKRKLKLPVIYAQDGQNLFDPWLSWNQNDWQVDRALELMAKSEDVYIVGIDSGPERMQEYEYSKRGNLYARFLIEELKPWIEKNFAVSPRREDNFLMGSSMGAVIAIETLWLHSDIFSKAAGLSISVFDQASPIDSLIENNFPAQPVSIYLDNGEIGEDFDFIRSVPLFAKTLKAKSPKSQIFQRSFPFFDHQESDWARRLTVPLGFLLALPRPTIAR